MITRTHKIDQKNREMKWELLVLSLELDIVTGISVEMNWMNFAFYWKEQIDAELWQT